MRHQWVLVAALVPGAWTADVARPRGVGPEFAKHYKSSESFACINNPHIRIPTARVNDNFCDCPDGSDEPGTSACAHLAHHAPAAGTREAWAGANGTLALPGFYCKNKGHQPGYVPATHVNDGVCDYEQCCDGSDEWEGVGGVKCADKCKEMGREFRKLDEARQKSMTSALKKRTELETTAARLRKEVEDKIRDLKVSLEGSRLKATDMENRLAEAERAARGKIVKGTTAAGRVGILAGLAKDRLESFRSALVQLQTQRDGAEAKVAELEQILRTFQSEYNPNFNDEGVKRAVRAWEDYAAREPVPDTAEGDSLRDVDLAELVKPEAESGVIDWAEWEKPEGDSDLDLLYDFEAYLPPTLRAWVDKQLRTLRLYLIEHGVLAPASEPSEDAAVASARNELNSAKSTLSSQERDLEESEKDLDAPYGPKEVFRALKGTCVSTDSGEYTYEYCFLAQAKQRSRKGGGETNMGNWAGSFEEITVDDELPADGRGLGSGVRTALRHDNGQGCWNGPSRSTLVVLACAEENELWKISEEEKCVYRMEVGTPAVCERRPAAKKADDAVKDEL